ncbi:hypothetical protein ABFS82_02G174200 [Erythranthe guttata]
MKLVAGRANSDSTTANNPTTDATETQFSATNATLAPPQTTGAANRTENSSEVKKCTELVVLSESQGTSIPSGAPCSICLEEYRVHAQNNYCPTSYCNSVAIQFPFWRQGRQLPSNCQPTGFNLSCNGQNKAILNIPRAGDFYVSYINYYLRRITLSDPDNCLPRKYLSSSLSYSPFMAISNQNYTFISCPKGLGSSDIYIVHCLSNDTTDVLVIKNEAAVAIFPECKKMVTVRVPVSSYEYSFPVNFDLRWDDSATGAENKRPVSRIFALAFVISSMVIPVVIIGIACCICMMRRNNLQDSGSNQTSGVTGLSNTVTTGLGISTIETYKKITIGESRRIEGPNGITCAICLADYVPQDTIRVMPECQHCFHVECIDQWLGIKAKCPICRASQA